MQGSLKQYVKWLIGSYIVIGIILLFNSKLIFDFSLSCQVLIILFVLCTIGYGVITLNKKYIISGVIVGVLYAAAMVIFSPIIMPNAHRNLIGDVNETEISREVSLTQLGIL